VGTRHYLVTDDTLGPIHLRDFIASHDSWDEVLTIENLKVYSKKMPCLISKYCPFKNEISYNFLAFKNVILEYRNIIST
jgi:hypothetical protein